MRGGMNPFPFFKNLVVNRWSAEIQGKQIALLHEQLAASEKRAAAHREESLLFEKRLLIEIEQNEKLAAEKEDLHAENEELKKKMATLQQKPASTIEVIPRPPRTLDW
jgi:uncharacterized protein YlxW (UPF0749 family)